MGQTNGKAASCVGTGDIDGTSGTEGCPAAAASTSRNSTRRGSLCRLSLAGGTRPGLSRFSFGRRSTPVTCGGFGSDEQHTAREGGNGSRSIGGGGGGGGGAKGTHLHGHGWRGMGTLLRSLPRGRRGSWRSPEPPGPAAEGAAAAAAAAAVAAATGLSGAAGGWLPRDLLLHVLSFLPPNDLALGGRLACKDAAQHFSRPQHATVRLGLPLPPHTPQSWPLWEQAGREALKDLPFRRKLGLLITAAGSGCEANVAWAWQLLKPCISPDVLPKLVCTYRELYGTCPGAVAAAGGHVGVLRWMLASRCPVDMAHARLVAAQHASLGALQAVARMSKTPTALAGPRLVLDDEVLDAAAASTTPDAQAKVQWVLQEGRCTLRVDTAAAAARAGWDCDRLAWMRERGCPLGGWRVLAGGLEHGEARTLDWLVGEAGSPDPRVLVEHLQACGGSSGGANIRRKGIRDVCATLGAAAGSSGRLETVRWLLERVGGQHAQVVERVAPAQLEQEGQGTEGAPPEVSAAEVLQCGEASGGEARACCLRWVATAALEAGARVGHLGVVQWLVGECGQALGASQRQQRQQQQQQQQAGHRPEEAPCRPLLSAGVLRSAVASGSIPTAAWLLRQGCCPPLDCTAYVLAASRGDVRMVAWLAHVAKCPWGGDTLSRVVQEWPRCGAHVRAHLHPQAQPQQLDSVCDLGCKEAVQSLVGAGCAPGCGERVLSEAVFRGHLALVSYIHGVVGCRLGDDVLLWAVRGGCQAVLDWVARRCGRVAPGGKGKLVAAAAVRGDVGTVMWVQRLVRRGVERGGGRKGLAGAVQGDQGSVAAA